MAKIILPYTIQNGNTADGGQVQQNFDSILTQVNGNLDGDNIADGIITLAKLASDVKVIENVYHTEELGDSFSVTPITVGSAETTILSLSITLSSSRYLLFMANVAYGYTTNASSTVKISTYVKESSNVLWEALNISSVTYDGTTAYYNGPVNFSASFIKQYLAGSYTFVITAQALDTNEVNAFARSFTIIQFSF